MLTHPRIISQLWLIEGCNTNKTLWRLSASCCVHFSLLCSGYKMLSYGILTVWFSSTLCYEMNALEQVNSSHYHVWTPAVHSIRSVANNCTICKARRVVTWLCWKEGSWERMFSQCTPKCTLKPCSKKIKMSGRQEDGWQKHQNFFSLQRPAQYLLRSLKTSVTFEIWSGSKKVLWVLTAWNLSCWTLPAEVKLNK